MKVEWRPDAEADLNAAFHYLQDRNPSVAIKLVAEVRRASHSLAAFPNRGRLGRAPDTRELSVPPYIMVYAIDPDKDRVTILRLWHAAQDR